MRVRLLFSNTESFFLKRLEISNQEEMLSWKLPNFYYPLCAIALSLISYLMFKDSNSQSFGAFVNLLLNGSIPMVALNRLSSLGVNIFRFDKSKERTKTNKDTYNLRLKLHYYSQLLVFGIALFYVFQVIHNPFDVSWWIILQLIVSFFCIEQSLKISKYAFLLQERLIDTTYDQEMRNEIKEKGHGTDWDNEN